MSTLSPAEALFPTVFGDCFPRLPESLQDFHGGQQSTEWSGPATVRGARSFPGRVVAAIFGFPTRDQETLARVTIECTEQGEKWTRQFGKHVFCSTLTLSDQAESNLLCERFGPVTVDRFIPHGMVWTSHINFA